MIESVTRAAVFPTTSKVSLPTDEGVHAGDKTEWWYLNGHLSDDQGREYGFMDALFDTPDIIDARYNHDLPLMPGAALLDAAFTQITEGRHTEFRSPRFFAPSSKVHDGFTPGILDQQFKDSRGLWKVQRVDDETIHLSGPHGDAQLDLTLKHKKAPILMGGEGEIPMGPFGSSKYYTWSRLEASGTVQIDGETRKVNGTAWMDHQWGDMQLFHGYDGWDWFGMQLDNGTDINAFRFRDANGENVQASVGCSQAEGTQTVSDKMELTPTGWWTSPQTGVRYPTSWHVVIPDRKIDLDVTPAFDDQEMNGGPPYGHPRLAPVPTYWEGAMNVQGTVAGQKVTGKAYGEFVGYGLSQEDRQLDASVIAEATSLAGAPAETATASERGA